MFTPYETPETRLASLGYNLDQPPGAVAMYRPWVTHNNMVFISGQLPIENQHLHQRYIGRLGVDVELEVALQAARLCAVNVLAQLSQAGGNQLSRLDRLVKITGYVACNDNFFHHPRVIDAASELLTDVLQADGMHSRAAVGVASLPMGACVEIEAVAFLRNADDQNEQHLLSNPGA